MDGFAPLVSMVSSCQVYPVTVPVGSSPVAGAGVSAVVVYPEGVPVELGELVAAGTDVGLGA